MALGLQSCGRAGSLLTRRDLWIPWLILGAFQAAILAALWAHAHPLVSPLLTPALVFLAGESSLHYPGVLRRLPALTLHAQVISFATLGMIAAGATAPGVAAVFEGRPAHAGRHLVAAVRRGAALVLAALPFFAAFVVVRRALESATATADGGGLLGAVQATGLFLAASLLRAAVLYLPALVMIEGRGAVSAWRELPGAWRRGGWSALTVVVAVTAPLLIVRVSATAWWAPHTAALPELALVAAAVDLGLGLAAAFWCFGAASLVYLSSVQFRREEE